MYNVLNLLSMLRGRTTTTMIQSQWKLRNYKNTKTHLRLNYFSAALIPLKKNNLTMWQLWLIIYYPRN